MKDKDSSSSDSDDSYILESISLSHKRHQSNDEDSDDAIDTDDISEADYAAENSYNEYKESPLILQNASDPKRNRCVSRDSAISSRHEHCIDSLSENMSTTTTTTTSKDSSSKDTISMTSQHSNHSHQNSVSSTPSSISTSTPTVTVSTSANKLNYEGKLAKINKKELHSSKPIRQLNLKNNHITTFKFDHDNSTPLVINTARRNIQFELNLTQLYHLDLSNNEILYFNLKFPLKKLIEIDLGHNKLIQFPDDIVHITTLVTLKLNSNQIKAIPTKISQLTQLEYLDLSHNQLIELPDELYSLIQLETLLLNKNYLKILKFEEGIKNFKQIKKNTSQQRNQNSHRNHPSPHYPHQQSKKAINYFVVTGNQLVNPPQAIANGGYGRIYSYMEEQKLSEEEKRRLNSPPLRVFVHGSESELNQFVIESLKQYKTIRQRSTHSHHLQSNSSDLPSSSSSPVCPHGIHHSHSYQSNLYMDDNHHNLDSLGSCQSQGLARSFSDGNFLHSRQISSNITITNIDFNVHNLELSLWDMTSANPMEFYPHIFYANQAVYLIVWDTSTPITQYVQPYIDHIYFSGSNRKIIVVGIVTRTDGHSIEELEQNKLQISKLLRNMKARRQQSSSQTAAATTAANGTANATLSSPDRNNNSGKNAPMFEKDVIILHKLPTDTDADTVSFHHPSDSIHSQSANDMSLLSTHEQRAGLELQRTRSYDSVFGSFMRTVSNVIRGNANHSQQLSHSTDTSPSKASQLSNRQANNDANLLKETQVLIEALVSYAANFSRNMNASQLLEREHFFDIYHHVNSHKHGEVDYCSIDDMKDCVDKCEEADADLYQFLKHNSRTGELFWLERSTSPFSSDDLSSYILFRPKEILDKFAQVSSFASFQNIVYTGQDSTVKDIYNWNNIKQMLFPAKIDSSYEEYWRKLLEVTLTIIRIPGELTAEEYQYVIPRSLEYHEYHTALDPSITGVIFLERSFEFSPSLNTYIPFYYWQIIRNIEDIIRIISLHERPLLSFHQNLIKIEFRNFILTLYHLNRQQQLHQQSQLSSQQPQQSQQQRQQLNHNEIRIEVQTSIFNTNVSLRKLDQICEIIENILMNLQYHGEAVSNYITKYAYCPTCKLESLKANHPHHHAMRRDQQQQQQQQQQYIVGRFDEMYLKQLRESQASCKNDELELSFWIGRSKICQANPFCKVRPDQLIPVPLDMMHKINSVIQSDHAFEYLQDEIVATTFKQPISRLKQSVVRVGLFCDNGIVDSKRRRMYQYQSYLSSVRYACSSNKVIHGGLLAISSGVCVRLEDKSNQADNNHNCLIITAEHLISSLPSWYSTKNYVFLIGDEKQWLYLAIGVTYGSDLRIFRDVMTLQIVEEIKPIPIKLYTADDVFQTNTTVVGLMAKVITESKLDLYMIPHEQSWTNTSFPLHSIVSSIAFNLKQNDSPANVNEVVCLMGYPKLYFTCVFGRIVTSDNLVGVDVSSENGWSGGPMFNRDGKVIGILSKSYDKMQYSYIEYLRDFVINAFNQLNSSRLQLK